MSELRGLYATVCLTVLTAISAHAQPRSSNQQSAGTRLFVATDGNDRWSGRFPSPNAGKTDGPFATVVGARDAIRKLKARGLAAPVTVMVRAGTYYLTEPIRFEPQDSGTKQGPIRYTAYPGDKPVLSGGRRITGWRSKDGKLFTARVLGVKQGKWYFRQLRAGDRRLTRARYPNYDPNDPIKGGWLFAREPQDWKGGFGTSVANIHNVGDYMEYEIDAAVTGEYAYWVYVGLRNKPHSGPDISGRTAIMIDGGDPVPLTNMTDTGNWRVFRWRRAADVHLSKGRHRLRWQNLEGGGVNFDAFALINDPNWKPKGTKLPPAGAGRHLLVVQAEAHVKAYGPQMSLYPGCGFRSKTEVYCDAGSLKKWPRSPELEIHVFPRYGWVNGIVPVVAVDPSRAVLRLPEKWPKEGKSQKEEVWVGNRFFVENVFEELDAPGEWYLDKATGTVHVLSEDESFARSEVVAPALDRVIEFRGDAEKNELVSHVTVDGFTITDTGYSPEVKSWYYPDDAAIWLVGATHCQVTGCVFRHIGGYAVSVKAGSADNHVVANEVVGAGQGGVFVDGAKPGSSRQPGPDALRPRRNLISGNHIHHCGLIYKHVAGVYITHADENIVSHNLIHDMPRYGISIKRHCDGNVIEFNEIRRTNLETNDTGAIEMYVNHKPTTIRYNIVADVIGLKTTPEGEFLTPFYSWGIYLDGHTSNATVVGNIVYRNYRAGLMINGGSNNLIENNVFVESATRHVEFNNYLSTGTGNKFRRNIIYYAAPDAATLRAGRWSKEFVQSDYNLFFHAGGELAVTLSSTKPQNWEDWLKLGMDNHSVIADPLFVNAAKDDYRLRPDSPAFKLGFKRIPVEKIGLRSRFVDGDHASNPIPHMRDGQLGWLLQDAPTR